MLEAAMLGIPYAGRMPDFGANGAAPPGGGMSGDAGGAAAQPLSPGVRRTRALREEQDWAYQASLQVPIVTFVLKLMPQRITRAMPSCLATRTARASWCDGLHAAAQADREKAEAEERAQREAQQESARIAAEAQAAAAAAAQASMHCSI